MPMSAIRGSLQLRSLITAGGELVLSLEDVPARAPVGDELLVRMQAAPIHPTDLVLLLSAADLSTLDTVGAGRSRVTRARLPAEAMQALNARIGQSLTVGSEGAGVVVAAGADVGDMIGRVVAVAGDATFAQYFLSRRGAVMEITEGVNARNTAACFVNPLTALAMTETMKAEGHAALVHTAAASSLGQILNRVCMEDGIPLVNVVRNEAQTSLLRKQGARFVCDLSAASFMHDLTEAISTTGATLAFDAVGGGKLAGQILRCMETAIARNAKGYSGYGSDVHKQVYVYGALDPRPTEVSRSFGLAWSIDGWLLMPVLKRLGRDGAQRLRRRVAAAVTTTFATSFARVISLDEALQPDVILGYARVGTGGKHLIDPAAGPD